MVKVGDRVRWMSQSQGYWRTKEGVVLAIVPKGKDVTSYIPDGIPPSRIKGQRVSKIDRILVEVQSRTVPDYYCPRPSQVEIVED